MVAANPGTASRTGTFQISGQTYTVIQSEPACPSGVLPASSVTLSSNCVAVFSHTAAAGDQIAFRAVGDFLSKILFPATLSIKLYGPAPSSTVLASATTGNGVTLLPASGTLTFPSTGTYSIVLTPALQDSGPITLEWLKTGSPCEPSIKTYALGSGLEALTRVDVGANTDPGRPSSTIFAAIGPGCPSLPASGGASWLRTGLTSISGGYTTIGPIIDPNPGAARASSIQIGSVSIPVSQAASTCTFALNGSTRSVDAGTATGTLQLTTQSNCYWTADRNATWIQTFPLSGMGSGPTTYTVFPNFGTSTRTASLTIGGRTFTVTQAPATGTVAERFVRLIYFSYFGRLPTTAEVAFQAGSGLSREQLALNFFNSPEFNNGGRFVAGLYVGLLNRDAEYDGWLFQRNAMAGGFVDQFTSVANFLASGEFTINNPGQTTRTFVTMLYRQVLLREPTVAEVDFHAGSITGSFTRPAAARNFLTGAEFAAGAGPRLTAFLAYACLLQRQPSPTELSAIATIAAQAQATPQLELRFARIRDQILAPFANSAEINLILQ